MFKPLFQEYHRQDVQHLISREKPVVVDSIIKVMVRKLSTVYFSWLQATSFHGAKHLDARRAKVPVTQV